MLKLIVLLLLFILIWMTIRRFLRIILIAGRGPNPTDRPFGDRGGTFREEPPATRRRGEKDITDRVRIIEERAGENDSARR